MQTRRRLHQHSITDIEPEQLEQHHQQQQQQQQQQQEQYQQYNSNYNYVNGVGLPTSATTESILEFGQVSPTATSTAASTVDVGNEVDFDDKYQKAGRWSFRSISNRWQLNSTQTIRQLIQPLSAAAAAVKGSYQDYVVTDCDNTQNNSNQNNTSIQNAPIDSTVDFYEDTLENFYSKETIVVMAARDRTTEFNNAIRLLQSRNISRAINLSDPRKVKQVQCHSEFMMVAKLVGKNIASTYAKLEKLTMLARKRSLFDDRPHEIQELTYIIKGDLNALNQQIARLQDISKEQRRSTSGKHLLSHSSNMVLALQSKLANMSTDFKQILEVRTENLKHQKSRRDQFGQSPLPAHTVPPTTAKHGSLLLSDENQASISIDMSSAGDASNTANHLHNQKQLQQQQQQQLMLYDESDNYVQQRAETMQNIESTIVELGGIFQQLAVMVKEQEEIVERIDTNIQDVELNIEAAHGEILKYFQTISKNRWLMIKIFGILICFFIFFIVFMA